MAHLWTVEAPEPVETNRFADAIRAYNDAPGPKRLLRNGKPLRVQTAADELDLFEETA